MSVDEIRGEIAAAKISAEDETVEIGDDDLYGDYEDTVVDEEFEAVAGQHHHEPTEAPSAQEIRAGWARIAGRLTDQAG